MRLHELHRIAAVKSMAGLLVRGELIGMTALRRAHGGFIVAAL
jgi:hypothetical protein